MAIIPIQSNSSIRDINKNFNAIQEAISSKQLSFHYLDLYTLKGSVVAETNTITRAYNLLNLNEALLIAVNPDENDPKPTEEQWRSNMTLYAGDYLVKTMAGPLRIPGPITGYYIPSFNDENDEIELTFTYTTAEPSINDDPIIKDIQGASGSGYDLTYTTLAVNTAQPFPAKYDSNDVLIQPIIQIYDPVDHMLIDYPYNLTLAGEALSEEYTLKLTTENEWTGKTLTVRVR